MEMVNKKILIITKIQVSNNKSLLFSTDQISSNFRNHEKQGNGKNMKAAEQPGNIIHDFLVLI